MKPPTATYRVQLNEAFDFYDLKAIVPYLAKLGISHIYASPIFQAKVGSIHGYDVLDSGKISEALGGKAAFDDLMREVSVYGLGWIQDIVPNHVAYSPLNPMVADVLRRGGQSEFYDYLDVDWSHPKLQGKILAPFLEDDYEACLHRGEIQLAYDNGVVVEYKGLKLPLRSESTREIAGRVDDDSYSPEQISIVIEKYNQNPQMLSQLLAKQVFELANWRTVKQKLNYRRFFDITDLICLRMDNNQIFQRTHRLVLELLKRGVDGVRIDHIDGLHDPKWYIDRLRQEQPNAFVVVEKILTDNEELPLNWKVEGTTGYEFINRINGLFVESANEQALDQVYRKFTGNDTPFQQIVYDCKKQVVEDSFAADMDNLTRLLLGVTKKREYGQEGGFEDLREALVEVFAAFPVYRAYLNGQTSGRKEQEPFLNALREAEKRNNKRAAQFSVIKKLLAEVGQSKDVLTVFMRLQQFTGVVMAKGFEDTALYCYCRLLSLNDVGGTPASFGYSPEQFHKFNRAKLAKWPLSLNASSTHDTKRGEDARARLNILSETPAEFQKHLDMWTKLNKPLKKSVNNKTTPDASEEYYLYQTLLGAYPFEHQELVTFPDRLKTHIIKALREAKQHTNWLSPNQNYEATVTEFALSLVNSEVFLASFLPFQKIIAQYGTYNSLSQTLLKVTCPGTPDFYQGAELWDLSMVDPDNRRPVDFQKRQQLLQKTTGSKPDFKELLQTCETGAMKLFLIYQALKVRNKNRALFQEGAYVPLKTGGKFRRHLMAFYRQQGSNFVLTAVPRCLVSLPKTNENPLHVDWQDTHIQVPNNAPQKWINSLTQKQITAFNGQLNAAEIFEEFPVGLLLAGEADAG